MTTHRLAWPDFLLQKLMRHPDLQGRADLGRDYIITLKTRHGTTWQEIDTAIDLILRRADVYNVDYFLAEYGFADGKADRRRLGAQKKAQLRDGFASAAGAATWRNIPEEQAWLDWFDGLPADRQRDISTRIETRVAQITGEYPTEPNLFDNVVARYVLRSYYRFFTQPRWQAFVLGEQARQANNEPCFYLQQLRARRRGTS